MASSTALRATDLNPSAPEDTSKSVIQADTPIPPVVFRSPRLFFRPLHPVDAQAIAAEGNNLRVSQYLRDTFPYPYTLDDAEEWIHYCQSLPPRTTVFGIFYNPPSAPQTTEDTVPEFTMRVSAPIEVDGSRERISPLNKGTIRQEEPRPGQFLGCIGLTPYRDMETSVSELGYWLGERWWRRGFATEAAAAICAWSFQTDELLRRIEALILDPNDASCRTLERLGFVFEGRKRQAAAKRGVVMDILVYSLLRDDMEDGAGDFVERE